MAVITIARQLGAGGKTLGEMVAKKLGYTFFDNEIIQMVAEKAKVSQDVVKTFENDTSGKFMKFFAGLVPSTFADRAREHSKEALDEIVYVDLLHLIIKQIAAQGDVVILGRGSQFVLQDEKDAYHVLLIADDAFRQRFLARKYQMSAEQAVEAMKTEDRRREKLYDKFGRDDYDSWRNYHLIVNMSRTDLHLAVQQICSLVSA